MRKKEMVMALLLGGALAAPALPVSAADKMDNKSDRTVTDKADRTRDKSQMQRGSDVNPYSDRDMTRVTKDEKEKLEQALKTGEDKNFYRQEIEKHGFKVTAVNYDKPDYVEYEIVKGDNSYEVQIDFDKNSKKASKVDVAPNIWRAEATKQAMERGDRAGKSTSRDKTSARDMKPTGKSETTRDSKPSSKSETTRDSKPAS